MRKILAVALLLAMTFLIAACGNSESAKVSAPAKPAQESSAPAPKSSAPADAPKKNSTAEAKSSDVPDVPEKHYAKNAVLFVVKNEILPPYGDGTFRGDRFITRYEFAMGLAKILDNYYKGNLPKTSIPFSDVPESHWAHDSIAKLAAASSIAGYGDGTFRGDRNITHYEAALHTAMLLEKIAPNSVSIKFDMPFPDVPENHWGYKPVLILANAGVVEGYGDGTFRGDRNTTRYDAARVLAKLCAVLRKAG